MVLHQALELQYWFWNVFAGSAKLFFLILLAASIALAAKFRMSMASFGVIFALFVTFFGTYYTPLYIFAGIIFAISIIPIIVRLINKS